MAYTIKHELDLYRKMMYRISNRIEKLALAMEAPNPHTPQFLALSIEIRQWNNFCITENWDEDWDSQNPPESNDAGE